MESTRMVLLPVILWAILVLVPAPAAAQTTHVVTVGDNFFNPSNLTIQAGDTVEWRNASGGNTHNVSANNGSFTSPSGSSFTYSQTFNTAGSTVNYRCTFHSGMTGVITVQGGTTTSPDIAVQSVDAENGTYEPGDSIDIDIGLQNSGNAASGGFTITYYASTNTTINTSDTSLGSDARASLNAGQSSNFTATGTLPASLAPGNYFIGAVVSLADSNSANNSNHDPTTITVQSAPVAFEINAGLNDSWYNPTTGGQGFFITVFPDIGKMFLAWFTYDTQRPPGTVTAQLGDPGHRWLTAFGDYSGDTATLAVELTEGGIFDTSPPAPTQSPDGTITVEFTSCTAGTVSFNIPSAGTSGSVAIQRIALDNVPFCESLQ